MSGGKPLIGASYQKPSTIALEEVDSGKVSYYEPEEAAKLRAEVEQRLKEREETEVRTIAAKEKERLAARREQAKEESA
jgi:hypothetical protein